MQSQNFFAPRIRQYIGTHCSRRLQCRVSAHQNVFDSHKLRERLGQRLSAAGDHEHAMLDRGETQWAIPVA